MFAVYILCWLVVGFVLTVLVDRYTKFFDGAPDDIRPFFCVLWFSYLLIVPIIVLNRAFQWVDSRIKLLPGKDR